MSFENEKNGERGTGRFDNEAGELEGALKEFRLSVHAWSEAAYSRPRTAAQAVSRRSWRLAVGWTLGCALVAGSFSGGLWEHHRQVLRMTEARMVEQKQLAADQRSQQVKQEDEDLLAQVDSDVSREVPSAMEPLAQLMAEDESK
jgi:hypothetical protein